MAVGAVVAGLQKVLRKPVLEKELSLAVCSLPDRIPQGLELFSRFFRGESDGNTKRFHPEGWNLFL